jgi:hypothetical protein
MHIAVAQQGLLHIAKLIDRDFPYGLMPTNGVGCFRDFLLSS